MQEMYTTNEYAKSKSAEYLHNNFVPIPTMSLNIKAEELPIYNNYFTFDKEEYNSQILPVEVYIPNQLIEAYKIEFQSAYFGRANPNSNLLDLKLFINKLQSRASSESTNLLRISAQHVQEYNKLYEKENTKLPKSNLIAEL